MDSFYKVRPNRGAVLACAHAAAVMTLAFHGRQGGGLVGLRRPGCRALPAFPPPPRASERALRDARACARGSDGSLTAKALLNDWGVRAPLHSLLPSSRFATSHTTHALQYGRTRARRRSRETTRCTSRPSSSAPSSGSASCTARSTRCGRPTTKGCVSQSRCVTDAPRSLSTTHTRTQRDPDASSAALAFCIPIPSPVPPCLDVCARACLLTWALRFGSRASRSCTSTSRAR